MRIIVIGANGFLGQALVRRLLDVGSLRGRSITALGLLDKQLDNFTEDEFKQDGRLRYYVGSITEPSLLRKALASGIDVVFHLASIPGGMAEEQYDLGYQINLVAGLELLEQLRSQSSAPVVVYASSVAVYGSNLPSPMSEHMIPRPELSYGTHKLLMETMISDLARRGEVDGRALRLPGIVARPRQPNGLRSAFMSDMIHAFANNESYQCPVSGEATAWWMSAMCCVENLIHAAELEGLGEQRVWQLPVLRLSMSQVVDVLAEGFGEDRRSLIEFNPDESLEALFGRYPELQTPVSSKMGFQHDGSPKLLINNALNL